MNSPCKRNRGPRASKRLFGSRAYNSGVTFALDDDKDIKNEARAKAMKDAMAKAELYASAAGLKVARIVSISEGYEASPQPMMMARSEKMMDAAEPTPVSGGEIGVTASVSVLFELTK